MKIRHLVLTMTMALMVFIPGTAMAVSVAAYHNGCTFSKDCNADAENKDLWCVPQLQCKGDRGIDTYVFSRPWDYAAYEGFRMVPGADGQLSKWKEFPRAKHLVLNAPGISALKKTLHAATELQGTVKTVIQYAVYGAPDIGKQRWVVQIWLEPADAELPVDIDTSSAPGCHCVGFDCTDSAAWDTIGGSADFLDGEKATAHRDSVSVGKDERAWCSTDKCADLWQICTGMKDAGKTGRIPIATCVENGNGDADATVELPCDSEVTRCLTKHDVAHKCNWRPCEGASLDGDYGKWNKSSCAEYWHMQYDGKNAVDVKKD